MTPARLVLSLILLFMALLMSSLVLGIAAAIAAGFGMPGAVQVSDLCLALVKGLPQVTVVTVVLTTLYSSGIKMKPRADPVEAIDASLQKIGQSMRGEDAPPRAQPAEDLNILQDKIDSLTADLKTARAELADERATGHIRWLKSQGLTATDIERARLLKNVPPRNGPKLEID